MRLRSKNPDHQRRPYDSASSNLFQRGSTLSSGRLQQIEARQRLQTKEQQTKQHRRVAYRLVVVGLVILFVIYMFATRISSVEVVDSSGHKLPEAVSKTYSADALASINHNWFNGFQPFVPMAHITKQILDQNPEIENLTVHNNGFSTTLTLKLSFRRPSLIWQTKNGSQFYLSSDGTAFENDYSGADTSKLIHLVDTSGLGAEEGKTLASSQMINFVISLHNQLEAAEVPVVQYSVPATLREVDVKLKGKPYIVKFLSTNDVGQEVAQLQQSLKFFAAHPDQTPTKYLDLRLVGRAFYQ